ncbi:hypothetical protein AN958_12319 [Leucoagaricus sp. SymC.cos]|nr:hypothetical protein AN958_12319 [Leucoagaricus sp. SymC.cos]
MERLSPFEINPNTREPFIRLRKHPNVIITPPRETDIPNVIPPLNDERVHIWLGSCPFPYATEHAKNWITKIKNNCDSGLKELTESLRAKNDGGDGSITLTHSPVRFLREIQEDGTEIFLGDIGITRCPDTTLLGSPKHDTATNSALPVLHPDVVWTLGFWVMPSHHGRGIMSDAIDTVIHDLAKPLLGAFHFSAHIFSGNEASNRTVIKNGFALTRSITNYGVIKGTMRDINTFERFDALNQQ